MASSPSTALVPRNFVFPTPPPSNGPDPIDLEGDDSDASVDSTFSSVTQLKKSIRKLRKDNKRLRQTQESKQRGIARQSYQQIQEAREASSNRAADAFAKKQTFLINLGDLANVVENTRKANQQAKEHVDRKKSAAKSKPKADLPSVSKKRRRQEDTPDTQPQNRGGRGGRTTAKRPAKKARASSESSDTPTELFELAELLERDQTQETSPDLQTPPATPSPAGTETKPTKCKGKGKAEAQAQAQAEAEATRQAKAKVKANQRTQAQARAQTQAQVQAAQVHKIPFLVALREGARLDFSAVLDLTTTQGLATAKKLFRFIGIPAEIHPSLFNALRKDFSELHSVFPIEMSSLFPGSREKAQGNNNEQNSIADPITCLRGYLRNRNPQADKSHGETFACKTCTGQGFFCYSLVCTKTRGGDGSVKNGILAVLLSMVATSRAQDAMPDREQFYRGEGELFVDGAL